MTSLPLHPVATPAPDGRGCSVVVDNLTAGYGTAHPVLRDVSLRVPCGECWAVVGPSGGGKTTLLRSLLGLVRPTCGTVCVTTGDTLSAAGRGSIGYIPQQLGLVRSMTARQNTLLGSLGRLPRWRSALGLFPAIEIERADEALDAVGLGGRGGERVTAMSGGERRRVAIARALVQRPRLLLADEILAEVDRVTARGILALLERIRAETGMTIVCVEHDLDAACQLAQRVVVMAGGRKVREAAPDELRGRDASDIFRAVALA